MDFKQYVALLRGVNVSGKNKISMSELKMSFEEYGFTKPKTYLNSGNVTFLSDMQDTVNIATTVEQMIKSKFNLEIPVCILQIDELNDILCNAPEWWDNDNKEIYDNLIFIMPPTTYEDVLNVLGEPNIEYEKIRVYNNAIFWSFVLKDYRKTNWWAKTADTKIGNKITIRTANTVRKILKL